MNFRKQRSQHRKHSLNIVNDSNKWKNLNRRRSQRDSREDSVDDVSVNDTDAYNQTDEIDWEQELFRKKLDQVDSDQDVEVQLTKKQTLLLATLLPDEIILKENFSSTEPKRLVGVLLMADVSGYTALSERYNNTGKTGTYRLTATLNAYLGSLIELIYSHGGDILKFAGDAFLAIWKTDRRSFLCHTIHAVIACALQIQHSFSSYETDVKVSLRVKLAISAGNIMFATIGNQIPMNYVAFGLPVQEAKMAESLCSSGEVKLTPNAWGHCYSRNYDHVIHDDGHVTIRAILYDPRENEICKPFGGLGPMLKTKKHFSALENLPDSIWTSPEGLSSEAANQYDALIFRKNILLAEERNMGAELRKFMIRPVLTQIDAQQPLEYLTEMRQVSVLFVTLKPQKCPYKQFITIVNDSYETMCELVYKSLGCVNKIILFDKDVMILIIFGLRGYKHQSEAQIALKCAYSIKKSVAALDGVREVSIGVTTGQVYCGVVGHPLRREYTVIGSTVNKAARLMCYFRDKITCDELTFVKSKMSTNAFTLLPSVNLKGIANSGKIYEYNEDIRVKELFNIPVIPRLLNRSDEVKYFEHWLAATENRDFDALLLIGEFGLGKSRLIEWMIRYARGAGHNVCHLTLTSIHSATPCLALSQIINQMLGLKEPIEGFKKEEAIVQLLKVYDDDLCFLNDIIKVRFAYHEGIYSHDEEKREAKAKTIFTKLMQSMPETHIICLDDLHSLDQLSWQFVSIMIQSMKIFAILTVRRETFNSDQAWLYDVFVASNIKKIILGPLTPEWVPPLACQILNVTAISNDLCQALQMKCKGMPGLVDMFVVHLFSSGALEIKKIKVNEIDDYAIENLVFPESELLRPHALNMNDQPTLDRLIEENKTEEIEICIVTQKDELNTDINVQNRDAIIMMQIDALTPYQQLLLKIGSVIGNVMGRDLLENIMYENNPLTTAKAIKRLFAMEILICGSTHARSQSRQLSKSITSYGSTFSTISGAVSSLVCECSFDWDPENNFDLPKYAFCKLLKFKSKKSRNAFYELLPMNQKKEFHARIVIYLQNNIPKCRSCGGTTVIYSKATLQEEIQAGFSENLTHEDEKDVRLTKCKRSNSVILNSIQILSESNNKATNIEDFDFAQTRDASRHSQKVPILKSQNKDDANTRRRSKRVTVTDFIFKDKSEEQLGKFNVFNMLRKVIEAESISDWHELGVIDTDDEEEPVEKIEKCRKVFKIKLEKGVSETDFNTCTCDELKITTYEQIIHHANIAEMKFIEIEFTIDVCYLNLLANNVETAFKKLEKIKALCTSPEIQEIIDSCHIKRFLGKIYTLLAGANLLISNYVAAKQAIAKATRIYHINRDNVMKFFRISHLLNTVKLNRKKYRINDAKMAADSIVCLNICTLLYSAMGDGYTAKMYAYRALKLIQQVECNLMNICEAFSNAIQVDLSLGFRDSTADTLQLAITTLKEFPRPFQSEELQSLGKLFLTVFRAGIARGVLPSATQTGYRAMTVSRFVHAYHVSMEIVPDLFYILLCRRHISEAIDVAKEALNMSKGRISHYITWYYALCIDLILDTGFELESPSDISRYAEYTTRESNSGRRRLVAGLWTYWLRADQEQKARRFEAEALALASPGDLQEGFLTNLISSMRLAEGMLESLARKMDDLRKVVDLMELRSLADRELASIESDAKMCRTIYPRWIILKAQSLYLSGRHSAASYALNQALDESRKIGNRLEEALTRAVSGNSEIWLSNAQSGHFIPWRDGYLLARNDWHQYLYTITAERVQPQNKHNAFLQYNDEV